MVQTESKFAPFSRFWEYSVRISEYYLNKCAVLEIETGKQVNGAETKFEMTNFNNGNKNDIKNCNNNRKVDDKIDNDKCIVMTKNINRVKFKI